MSSPRPASKRPVASRRAFRIRQHPVLHMFEKPFGRLSGQRAASLHGGPEILICKWMKKESVMADPDTCGNDLQNKAMVTR